MGVRVYIAPHERAEAIEAYRDKLNTKAIEQIREAPEDKIVSLTWDWSETDVKVEVHDA